MKRNRFRLETVMRIRRIQQDIERGRLLLAQSHVTMAERREAEQTMAYHDVVALSAQTANAVTFLAGRDRLDRFGDSVVQSQEDVADASVTLDARRGDWSAAAQRVSALERLYERHTDARHADFLATEVQDTDERTMQRGLNALNQSKSLGELQ